MLTFLFITTIIITRGFRIICGFARFTCSFLIFYSSMQTRELYKTLVYNFSHGCRYSYNAYLETLMTTVSTFTLHTHVTRFNMSFPNWYLLENSQHNPKRSEKSHTQTSKCDRMKQTAVYMYCCSVFMFIHLVCHRFKSSRKFHCVTGWAVHSILKHYGAVRTSGTPCPVTQRHIPEDMKLAHTALFEVRTSVPSLHGHWRWNVVLLIHPNTHGSKDGAETCHTAQKSRRCRMIVCLCSDSLLGHRVVVNTQCTTQHCGASI